MGFKLKEQIKGAEQAFAQLEGLGKKAVKKAVRKAASLAGKLVNKAAKAKAPRELGLLKKSIAQKVKVYANTGKAVAIVGPRKGFRVPATRARGKWNPSAVKPDGYADPVKYAHLVEKGHGPAKKRRGKLRGGNKGAAPRPFLRPALESQRGAIVAAMADVVKQALGA